MQISFAAYLSPATKLLSLQLKYQDNRSSILGKKIFFETDFKKNLKLGKEQKSFQIED